MGCTRRGFIRTAAGLGAVLANGGCGGLLRRKVPLVSRVPKGRLNVGIIGVGGRGQANWSAVCEAGDRIAALCDVDEAALLAGRERVALTNPGVRLYKDFRVMLEAEKGLDAVFISTPDHGHAVQALWAMDKGCHVYIEPPLTRTLGELRLLRERAASHKVLMRLGDQGSATPEFRRAVELLKSGLIGEVQEIRAWTGRPVWPQGLLRPEGGDPVPETLDWDLWLGCAEPRPYLDKVYHRFNWRGWHAFGTGALGDVGVHLLNVPFCGLELGAPLAVEAVEVIERQPESYPKASHLRYAIEAGGRKKKPVTLDWYDGNWRPKPEQMPQVTEAFGLLPGSGCLLVGDRGVWLVADDLGTKHFVALQGEPRVVDFEKHEACASVAAPPKGEGLQKAFLSAVREGGWSQDGHARTAPLMETVLAGCVAQRVSGRLAWNSRKGRFNSDDADRLVTQACREGWSVPAR